MKTSSISWVKWWLAALGALALATSAAGCGNTSGPVKPFRDPAAGSPAPATTDQCDEYAPCGGQLVGRWRVSGSCFGGSFTNDPACKDYASGQVVSGDAVYQFGSDGSLSYTGALTITYDISVSEACAQAIAKKDAASYCKLVEDGMDDNPSAPATITCDASSGACACHVVEGPISNGNNDVFTTSSKRVTITTQGASNTYSYCVSGDTLTLGNVTGEPNLIFSRD